MIDRWTLETGRPPHQNDRVRYNHRRGWSPSRNQGVSKGLRLRLGRYDGSRQLETAVGGCRSSAQSRPGGRVQQRPGSSTTTRPGWLGAAESDLASAVESALDLETRMSTAASAVVDSRHEPRAHSPSRRTFSQAKTSPLTFARRRSIRMVAPCRRGCTEGSPLERTHRATQLILDACNGLCCGSGASIRCRCGRAWNGARTRDASTCATRSHAGR